MIVDRSHRGWALASAAVLAVASAAYALEPSPARGGNWLGLIFGTGAFAAMSIATLLSLRKKFPIWRIGRTQAWMRAHLWLGALTLPLVVLHAGFRSGHGLTAVLMWLLVFVYASGVYGAWLQHTLPRRIMRDVPMETIYEQIAHVRAQLVDEADTLVAEASGKLEVAVPVAASGANALASVMRVEADDSAPLREFYVNEMRPFLEQPSRRHLLADPRGAQARLDKLRSLIPPALAAAVTDLESICEEERQLMRQQRMHRALHAWLLVHAPLSFAVMTLAVVHLVMALRY